MSNDVASNTAFVGASGSGIATIIMHFFNANAAGIGALCTLGTFLIYATISFFKWRHYRHANLRHKLPEESLYMQ